MFLNIQRIISRHGRKFMIGGVIVGGLVFLTKYSQYKINEWQRQEVQQVLQRSRRSQHFESTERSCNQTIMNLAGSVKTSILKVLDTEILINDLKTGNCGKIAGWNKLKIFSISKPVAIIYAHVMFVFTLRIQLNLISANMFKNSQKTGENLELDETVQEKYLTLCSYFMDEGIHKLTAFIKEKVEEVVSSVSLTDKFSLKDVEQLHWSIMSNILADETRNPVKNLPTYMLAMDVNSEMNNSLNKVMNVTVDLLESDEVQSLMQSNIRSGFVLLIDRISKFFYEQFDSTGANISTHSDGNNIAFNSEDCGKSWMQNKPYLNLHDITMPMAKLIPILNGQIQSLPSSHDFHFNWLHSLISDEKLQIFSANVYEAFSF